MSFLPTPPDIGIAGPVSTGLGAIQGAVRSPFGLAQNLMPSPVLGAFGAAPAQAPQIYQRNRQNLTTLMNKYEDAEIAPTVAQLSTPVRNALFSFDAERIANGAPPLTRRQTLLVAQAAQNREEATPAPDKKPTNFLGNLRDDLKTTLSALPRLPGGIVKEIMSIPSIGSHIAEAASEGDNPIAALASAPGIRMLPGAYLAENLARGGEGVRELASHPLFTALDVLPLAQGAAKGTRVATMAREADDVLRAAGQPARYGSAIGGRPRDLKALMLNRLDETGEGLVRNRLGRAVDSMAMGEVPLLGPLGVAASTAFGRDARFTERLRGGMGQRANALSQGAAVPASELESMSQYFSDFERRHADKYPELSAEMEMTPEAHAFRAKLHDDFVHGRLDEYDDALISDYREMQDRISRHMVNQDLLGRFDGELYPTPVARKLNARQAQVDANRAIFDFRNEYVNPTGQVTRATIDQMMDRVLVLPTGQRHAAADAFRQVLDAYGYDDALLSEAWKKIPKTSRQDWAAWMDDIERITGAAEPVARRSVNAGADSLIPILRRYGRNDRLVAKLESAIQHGERGEASTILRNLSKRKPPPNMSDVEWDVIREDLRSASRRMQYEDRVGRRVTEARLAQQEAAFEKLRDKNAPARFHAFIADGTRDEIARQAIESGEVTLGRNMTAEEVGQMTQWVEEQRWDRVFPDMDPIERSRMLQGIQNDVASTWRTLRAAGHDPLFVHKVSPNRANVLATFDVSPVPKALSQTKERAIDLSPGANDVQVALSHQALELLMEQEYRPRYIETVLESVGKPEAELREMYADVARRRFERRPDRDFESHLQHVMSQGWVKFDMDTRGSGWGAARLGKFAQQDYWIPRSMDENLDRLTRPPGVISKVMDPVTKFFRVNVIGLSPSVVVNNFLSNAVAVTAEQGFTPFRYWSKAREWMADPSKIPSEELKAMMLAENPNHFSLSQQDFRKSAAGAKFFEGRLAGEAFQQSAAAEAVRTGRRAVDAITEKMYAAQQWGDNIYRAMTYMDEFEKASRAGGDVAQAEARAMEAVRRTLIDYTSFTPIERQAIRSIVPFYSYMGHAARFISRYPLDHPVRMMVMSKIADAERERLGGLPGSFLQMLTLGGMDDDGNQLAIPLAPFDPFGDIADLMSVSGWMSSMNPLISTALEQAGIVRGEVDPYPTLRYDEASGTLKPVQPSVLNSLISNVAPRVGAIQSVLGLNSDFEALEKRDPAAAIRSLAGQFGLPRLTRQINVPEARMRAELARQSAETDVKNEALKSGNWSEAIRYPNLRAIFESLDSAASQNPDAFGEFSPVESKAIVTQLQQLYEGAP